MIGTYPLPLIQQDQDGVWRDPMPLEAMSPRQRGLFVRLLREDAGFGGPKAVMRQARAFVEEIISLAADIERGAGPRESGTLE